MREINGARSGDPSDLVLFGREADLARVRDFLASRANSSLVIRSEPGAGETMLIDTAQRLAADKGFRVLRAAGVEFETDVGYAGLHHVCFPLAGELDSLRPEYRDALRVALGFGTGPAPNRLVVSNAALALLRHCAQQVPVLVLVDDLQWLDRASIGVLDFMFRRLSGDDGVCFLSTVRHGWDGFFELGDLPVHELGSLDELSAERLVSAHYPRLAEPVRRRLLTEAGGNPLVLLELAAALSEPQRRAEAELPATLPLSHRLQALFAKRVARLPRPTRQLLLLSTLDGTGDLGVLLAASRRLPDKPQLGDLAAAETAQLVAIDDTTNRLTFRHPLTKSAVMTVSTSAERRTVHAALAGALADDPERRAWHLGLASVGPDEGVAELLENAARYKSARSDPAGAVSALIRSAELSALPTNRARRLAQAAFISAEEMGQLDKAAELLACVHQADPSRTPSLHAVAAQALVLVNGDGQIDTAHRLLAEAIEASDHDAGDPAFIDAFYLLKLLCFFGGRAELWEAFHRNLAVVRPEPPVLLTTLGATFSDPARTGLGVLPQLESFIEAGRRETDPRSLVRLGIASVFVDRMNAVRAPSWRLVQQGREGGPPRRHIHSLVLLCLDDFHSGQWEEAAELAIEGQRRCADSGYLFFTWYFDYIQALLAAVEGDPDTNRDLTDGMIRWAGPRGANTAIRAAKHARALAELGVGDFESAYTTAVHINPPGELASHAPHAMWSAMDLVEVAVRTQRYDEAIAHARALRESDVPHLSSRLALITAGATAMATRDDRSACQEYERALAVPGADRWPFDLARVKLAYGERLRRCRATAQARAPLAEALGAFDRLGANPWAERARVQLRATRWAGDRVQPKAQASARAKAQAQPQDKPHPVLTPQERQIALLAASGLTNRQIGERLFISHRTVGAHLYQIFPKLGISSRAALRDALTHQEL